MSSKSSEYEKFIAGLAENIQGIHDRNITNINYGAKNEIIGASGQPHQIDVSFIDNDFPEPTLILIECKCYNGHKVKLEHAKTLKATLDDILAQENTPSKGAAIIVTTEEIQPGAKKYSEYYGIRYEKVGFDGNYVFQYENIIQAGIKISTKVTVRAEATLMRKCKSCGNQFEVIDNESICSNCQ